MNDTMYDHDATIHDPGPMDEIDPPAPPPAPETTRPRAWGIPYGATDNVFSVVGTSALDVVKMVENLKKQYHDKPDEFAPFKVLNHGPKGGVDTIWLIPSLVLGVYSEHRYVEEDQANGPGGGAGLEGFLETLAKGARRSQGGVEVIEVDPAKGDDDGGGSSDAIG